MYTRRAYDTRYMNVLLVHGYLGFPENNWFPWLRSELELRGYTVIVPALPHPAWPIRAEWTQMLVDTLRNLDPGETILVGHSLGCIALLYAVAELHAERPFRSAVLCAGFGRDFLRTDRLTHWFTPPPDFTQILSRVKQWTCVHSKDDALVPFVEGEWLAQQLQAKFVALEGMGHLTKVMNGIVELPSALEAIIGAEKY